MGSISVKNERRPVCARCDSMMWASNIKTEQQPDGKSEKNERIRAASFNQHKCRQAESKPSNYSLVLVIARSSYYDPMLYQYCLYKKQSEYA